jgi:hypothetical protein
VSERALTVDEYLEAIRPEIENDVDTWIMGHPPEVRRILMRAREELIAKTMIANKIETLERRLAEAEARLKPRLVQE